MGVLKREIPDFLKDNPNPKFELRPYQGETSSLSLRSSASSAVHLLLPLFVPLEKNHPSPSVPVCVRRPSR